LRLFRLWPFTPEAARIYARVYAELRRNGHSIGSMDLMIAAIALSLDRCTLVTKDSDFGFVAGLKIENWANPAP
jgi:tRNA(fMet)-specific endonuclease VapC